MSNLKMIIKGGLNKKVGWKIGKKFFNNFPKYPRDRGKRDLKCSFGWTKLRNIFFFFIKMVFHRKNNKLIFENWSQKSKNWKRVGALIIISRVLNYKYGIVLRLKSSNASIVLEVIGPHCSDAFWADVSELLHGPIIIYF